MESLAIPTETKVTDEPSGPDEVGIPTANPLHRFDSLKLERRGVTAHLRQGNLWQKETMWRDSIVAKLKQAGRADLSTIVEQCHTDRSIRICTSCKAARIFWNRCEVKWCPICAERLARERRDSLDFWVKLVKQPKHVVLTARNTDQFSKEYVLWFKAQFRKLRNQKFASNWKGGFYSLEVTWADEGAHLHIHALVDAGWIDSGKLAMAWGKLMGQDFAIVKVKDAREKTYLSEVAKYLVKGSELAKWSGQKLATFIEAIDRVRMFGVFGKELYGKRTEWAEWIATLHSQRNVCECGCSSWEIHDAHHWELIHGLAEPQHASIPPPRDRETLLLAL